MNTDQRIDSLCLKGLLRYFGVGPRGIVTPSVIRLNHNDIEYLKFWWALSTTVSNLAERTRSRPREIAGVVGSEDIIAVGEIPGTLDACETIRIQSRTGDPSLFAVIEPSPTWISGPNRLLALTLLEAERSILAAERVMAKGVFQSLVLEKAKLVEDALRVSALREILSSPAGRSRLTPFERKQAGKARTPLYRLAYAAAELLHGIGDIVPESIQELFSEGVLQNLEKWRKFELATALACAESISNAMGTPFILDTSFSSTRPIATVGRFKIWWQKTIPSRPNSLLDTGELMVKNLAFTLGVSEGSGRSDLLIESNDIPISLIECKWFEDASSSHNAIIDACNQTVRYARDLCRHRGGKLQTILNNSIISLADRGTAPLVLNNRSIGCMGLKDMEMGELDGWSANIIATY